MARKPTQEDQSKRFKDKARELGCDESEDRFNSTLKQIVPNKQGSKPAS